MTRREREALLEAKRAYMPRPGVTAVSWGLKRKGGTLTSEKSIVVTVAKKLHLASVPAGELIPYRIIGVPTDVQEGTFEALSLTGNPRPCPTGYSVGHFAISAGTLGFYGRQAGRPGVYLFTNNHVAANENECSPGDPVLQPGPVDGGTIEDDTFARLEEYVRIRFDGEEPGGSKKSAAYAWRAWRSPAHLLARILGCPYRLEIRAPHEVPAPEGHNLVDAACARVIDPDLAEEDTIAGVRDFQLGDSVEKRGRTTEKTFGRIEGVYADAKVQYSAGTATFTDQYLIRGDSGDFSAGGDSGSAIYDLDGYLGGLLFAGGGGVTLANRITHVLAALGGVV
jgi:hypothetical protein